MIVRKAVVKFTPKIAAPWRLICTTLNVGDFATINRKTYCMYADGVMDIYTFIRPKLMKKDGWNVDIDEERVNAAWDLIDKPIELKDFVGRDGYISVIRDGFELCLEPCLNGFDVALYDAKSQELLIPKRCTNKSRDIAFEEIEQCAIEFANDMWNHRR